VTTPIPSAVAVVSEVPFVSPPPFATPSFLAVASAPATAAPSDPDLIFADETLDAASGWRQLSVNKAAFGFASGALSSTYEKKGSWAYAVRQLTSPETVLRVGGQFSSSGLGYFGWLCGDSSTGRYYGAVPETDGSLVFIDGGYEGVEPLERYEDLGAPITDGSATKMGMECAINHGTLWLEAYMDDGEPIAVHEEGVEDVTRFDVIGMYGEALEPGFTTAVDEVSARGTDDPAGSLSFSAVPLAGYGAVASSAETACVETPVSGPNVTSVTCYLQDEGDGPELLVLTGYPDADAMDAAYEGGEVSACADAPAPTLWSRGAVRCATQRVGTDVQWTDSSLDLVGHLIDFDGDAAATQSAWGDIVGAN